VVAVRWAARPKARPIPAARFGQGSRSQASTGFVAAGPKRAYLSLVQVRKICPGMPRQGGQAGLGSWGEIRRAI
jgi:hypothetical protein